MSVAHLNERSLQRVLYVLMLTFNGTVRSCMVHRTELDLDTQRLEEILKKIGHKGIPVVRLGY